MSRFKNEVAHLQAHVKTLRLGGGALFVVALLLGFGWWSAPKDLTIHVPPDLRSGSTRKWWDVPPESVYAFSFYIWQQVQRWPTNGEEDYPRNLRALSAYLTPSCRAFLQQDYEYRRASGELRQRVRGIYEIPGRGYGDDPRALQGNFVAATFQHPNLGPAGTASDTTVLYLVTRGHGLAESLLPALSPIDASVNLPPAAAAGSTGGARDEE